MTMTIAFQNTQCHIRNVIKSASPDFESYHFVRETIKSKWKACIQLFI